MNARVVCHVRAGVTLTFRLKNQEAVMGRDPAVAVSVPVEGVSRQHAKIRWDGKSYWLEDLRSTNGTFLNGQAAARERLKHLDVIGLGRKIDLIFLMRAPEEAAVPSPPRQGIVAASLVLEGEGLAPIEIAPGEVTLGRAASNNVVAESSSVSKVHARIERTVDQLLLEDLGSANGTFVNGSKVMTAFLKDGDVVSLAGVEGYRVSIAMGEVKGFGSSGRMRAPAVPAERQRFAAEWKTRFEWDSGEREALEDLRRQMRERERAREAQKAGKADGVKAPAVKGRSVARPLAPGITARTPAKPVVAAVAPKPVVVGKPEAGAKPEVAKPAAAAKPTVPTGPAPAKTSGPADPKPAVSAEKPAAPAPAAPARPAPTATLGAAPPAVVKPAVAAPVVAKPVPPAPPPSPAPASTAPPVPSAERPAPAPSPVGGTELVPSLPAGPSPAALSNPKGTRAILELRLEAEGYDLVVRETGAHELGRAAEAPLRVNHPTVSRKHARIILADDRGIAYLQDAGGANGTRLNGHSIEKLAALSAGDRIGIGEVELKVVLKRG